MHRPHLRKLNHAPDAAGLDAEEEAKAPDFQACLLKQAECMLSAYQFSDDRCADLMIMVTSARSQTAACYEYSCAEVKACTSPLYGN